ncbi:MAG: hypothetical protein GQ545_03175, partial [Candidatus Aminicenantes bacterium]|nr:hypothetical protein [Candidatus Aminicenantes bacterium]
VSFIQKQRSPFFLKKDSGAKIAAYRPENDKAKCTSCAHYETVGRDCQLDLFEKNRDRNAKKQ